MSETLSREEAHKILDGLRIATPRAAGSATFSRVIIDEPNGCPDGFHIWKGPRCVRCDIIDSLQWHPGDPCRNCGSDDTGWDDDYVPFCRTCRSPGVA